MQYLCLHAFITHLLRDVMDSSENQVCYCAWALSQAQCFAAIFILLSVRLDQQIAPWGEKSPIFLENFRGKSDLDHHVVVIDSRRCRQILVVIKISQMNILPPRQSNPINLPLKFLAVEVKNVHFLNLWSFIRCWKNGVLKFCICEYDGLKVNQQRSLKLWR